MLAVEQMIKVSRQASGAAGLAGSALANRAQDLLSDRARSRRALIHRVWTRVSVVLGLLLLGASLAVLKFDVATTQKAQQFATLMSIFGVLLLATGLLVGWHSSAVERQLLRLALLRLNLDSVEATAELVRMQTRLSLALKQCSELPEGRRGECAIEMLEVLNDLEARAQASLLVSDLPQHTIDRLISLGVQREVLDCLASGVSMTLKIDASDGTQTAGKAA